MSFPDPVAANASGRLRMKAIAAENSVDIEKQTAHLIQGLKRPPTAGELIEAELVAVAFIKARRLRLNGKDDSRERQLLRDLMASTIFGSVPEQTAAEIQHGREIDQAYKRHDAERARAASREPWGTEAGETAPDGPLVTDGAAVTDEAGK